MTGPTRGMAGNVDTLARRRKTSAAVVASPLRPEPVRPISSSQVGSGWRVFPIRTYGPGPARTPVPACRDA